MQAKRISGQSRRRTPSSGFTLVELLVVIAIVGILVALLLPAVNAAREAAHGTSCKNNLRNIGVGILNYESARGYFPPGQFRWTIGGDTYAWSVAILPYIEESAIFDRIDMNLPMTSKRNKGTADVPGPVTNVIELYICPSSGLIHASREDARIGIVGGFEMWATEETLRADEDARPMGGLGAIDYLAISGPYRNRKDPLGNPYQRNRGVFLSLKENTDSRKAQSSIAHSIP